MIRKFIKFKSTKINQIEKSIKGISIREVDLFRVFFLIRVYLWLLLRVILLIFVHDFWSCFYLKGQFALCTLDFFVRPTFQLVILFLLLVPTRVLRYRVCKRVLRSLAIKRECVAAWRPRTVGTQRRSSGIAYSHQKDTKLRPWFVSNCRATQIKLQRRRATSCPEQRRILDFGLQL